MRHWSASAVVLKVAVLKKLKPLAPSNAVRTALSPRLRVLLSTAKVMSA